MDRKEFKRNYVVGYDVIQQEDGTLYIRGANFYPETIDYTNEGQVKVLATNAVHTADGFYDLIHKNCDISKPNIAPNAHLEMYLSLAALSCEIYLKSIIYFENLHQGKKVWGHKLEELFTVIPSEHQEQIRSKIKNIDEEIDSIGKIFISLRYDFELNHIEGNYLLAFDLMEELKTIAHSYPKVNCGAIRYVNGELALL